MDRTKNVNGLLKEVYNHENPIRPFYTLSTSDYHDMQITDEDVNLTKEHIRLECSICF
ncbi:MAG: hypothetical protein ACUZ8E_07340 [Candidatus Anammoxibacter sp.]